MTIDDINWLTHMSDSAGEFETGLAKRNEAPEGSSSMGSESESNETKTIKRRM